MSLSIGIVGLPNVGKSTLFNALTNNNILAANYPFATIEPNTGIVPVPDSRLEVLAEIYGSKKILPATVEFVDIAGLVAGASKGEGLGNQFLANIRQCNAIIHIVRAFEDADIQHVRNRDQLANSKDAVQTTVANARADIEIINTELILADLQTLENHQPKLEKEVKANPKLSYLLDELNKLFIQLQEGSPLASIADSDSELLAKLQLLSAKPVIYVFNVDETGLINQKLQNELSELVAPAQALFVSARLEEELNSLAQDESAELLASYGVKQPGLTQLIQAAYKLLGLQSYLTAGPKEVHAWTIRQGWTAPQAAGVIHTDFERGFIAAQVVDFNDLVEAGSESAARAAGKIRTEGKTYVMQPNDVVEFKFNV